MFTALRSVGELASQIIGIGMALHATPSKSEDVEFHFNDLIFWCDICNSKKCRLGILYLRSPISYCA
jgi:hypothetical protein